MNHFKASISFKILREKTISSYKHYRVEYKLCIGPKDCTRDVKETAFSGCFGLTCSFHKDQNPSFFVREAWHCRQARLCLWTYWVVIIRKYLRISLLARTVYIFLLLENASLTQEFWLTLCFTRTFSCEGVGEI